jgi:tyrosinase
MLHANVDRLWAKWQWIHKRTSAGEPRAFAPAVPPRVGHNLADTMWPWNGVTGAPRPSTAPGGTLATSPSTTAPGLSPVVSAMIDYQAVGGGPALGFAYDDVPFEV